MRTLMKISIPVEAGNTSIREGRLPMVFEQTLDRLKPEAAYFFSDQGRRSALVVFDLTDPSEIPVIAEPLFDSFNAGVEFFPVMNLEQLRKGLGSLGASASASAPGAPRSTAAPR